MYGQQDTNRGGQTDGQMQCFQRNLNPDTNKLSGMIKLEQFVLASLISF